MTGPRRVLALDVGGTKLAAAVVDGTGRVAGFRAVPADRHDGPDAMIERHVALGREVVEDAAGGDWDSIDVVGVGVGGPLDPERGIVHSPPNLPGWDRIPLAEIVAAAFRRPTYVENDATAAALAEAWWGSGRGCGTFVYLTISTGIGGGIVVDGRLLRGANGNAGELGHISVDYRGWPCSGCGRRGCLEAFASGTNIAQRAREAIEAAVAAGHPERADGLLALAGSAQAITAEHLSAAAASGDPLATEIWNATTEVLGAGVATILDVFNPDRVALGGGVTRAGDALLVPVRRAALVAALPPAASAAEIVIAELGDRVGVAGAAAIALERSGSLSPVAR
ncbi:MAG TPA: ROK family protein [Candidatus Limnocylindrales bacterium]|nr:ROK family protein [Candidatus Limnocylindrales bacterium]